MECARLPFRSDRKWRRECSSFVARILFSKPLLSLFHQLCKASCKKKKSARVQSLTNNRSRRWCWGNEPCFLRSISRKEVILTLPALDVCEFVLLWMRLAKNRGERRVTGWKEPSFPQYRINQSCQRFNVFLPLGRPTATGSKRKEGKKQWDKHEEQEKQIVFTMEVTTGSS